MIPESTFHLDVGIALYGNIVKVLSKLLSDQRQRIGTNRALARFGCGPAALCLIVGETSCSGLS